MLDSGAYLRELDAIARLSYTDIGEAMSRLRSLPSIPGASFARDAVAVLIGHNLRAMAVRERDVREEFYANLGQYLPGAEAVRCSAIESGNIPDGFVIWRERETPVEIKRGDFGPAALAQLQRYMSAYDSEFGIAVAQRLACDLPENVTYVQVAVA